MSWEIFKQTILRVANNPESIPDRNTVAKLYANAYDAAIKNGGDAINKTPLIRGNVESMRELFLVALEKGVTTYGPYDLVAQMGDGVKAYWANATMGKLPVPAQPPAGGVNNINIEENIIIDVGQWITPLKPPIRKSESNIIKIAPKETPKEVDNYNLRKMLDDAGYAAIKKYEDEHGCVTLISGKTGLKLEDWKQSGCKGYNPGMDAQEQIIKKRIGTVLGFGVWTKIPPLFRLQIYSFMYNADSSADADKFRWIAGLLQAAKNETSQYRTNVRTNEVIRNTEIPYLKNLTTADFQKIYPTYLTVLDDMYKSISDTEFKSASNKKTNTEKAAAVRNGAAYNLTWKDRPKEIENYYNTPQFIKKDKAPEEPVQETKPQSKEPEQPTSERPLKSGPIDPTSNTSILVDYFIKTAINHLDTIQGVIYTKTNYGAFIGPGVINWKGYLVKGTAIKKEVFVIEDFTIDVENFLELSGDETLGGVSGFEYEEPPTENNQKAGSGGKTLKGVKLTKNLNRGWQGKEVSFRRTIVNPATEGPKLKKLYGANIAKCMLACMKNEQGFKGFNNNIGGYDITAGGWRYEADLHDGFVYAKEGSTGLLKAFCSFKTLEAFYSKTSKKFIERGADKITNASQFSTFYYEKWFGGDSATANAFKNYPGISKAKGGRFTTLEEYRTKSKATFASMYNDIVQYVK